MKLEKFKEKIADIEVLDTRWKEKMMTVANLYKSMGHGLNEILDNPNVLYDEVHYYLVEVLEKIIEPTTEKFYINMLLQRESSDINKVKAKLTPEYVTKMLTEEFDNTGYDINYEEAFIDRKNCDFAFRAAKTLISDSEFKSKMLSHLLNRQEVKSKKEFIENMTKTKRGALRYVSEYIASEPTAKKAFDMLFIKEMQAETKEKSLEIRAGLVNRILRINQFFYRCGYLTEIEETNNAIMSRFNIPMKVSMEDSKTDFNLLNLLDQNYYGQFSTEELFVLSAFYCNRLEKIVENIHDGIYLHAKLGSFYDTIDYGEVPRGIDLSDARVVLKQKYFMEELSKEDFKAFKEKEFEEGDKIDFSHVPEEYIKEYEKVYKEYFSRYIRGCVNDFREDYRFAFVNRSISYCMYNLKDFSIESLLYTLSQNKSKINFGLIKERRSVKNEYGEEQVLIGVDYKEFPSIRLHFPKKDYDAFVERFFPDGDFQEYIGNEDFTINGVEIKTPILYKFTKKQKQAIKKEMEEEAKKNPNSDKYKFLRHMYENIHPNQNKQNKKKKSNDFDEI